MDSNQSRPKILICDDKSEVANHLSDRLEEEYETSIAYTPNESIEMLEFNSRKPNIEDRFAVAIIDLSFESTLGPPGIEGFSILRAAVKDPFLEPIIFTGTGDEIKAYEAMSLGAFRYVAKGKTVEDQSSIAMLRSAIAAALECRKAIRSLDLAIARLKTKQGVDNEILPLCISVIENIQFIRGRRPRSG